ncbi:MAG: S4 domain-containing protein, partial [Crocosphaera sp.]
MVERVQKILSQWGVASRRRAEDMIMAGRVKLNGKIVTLGDKADPSCDRLEVDGKLI